MSTTYFKVLDVHEYGWYAYAEDDFFILGDDYPHEGGELYRGEFKEDKIPYLNEFKRDCPEAYDNAVKYFNSRPKNNIENALMIAMGKLHDKFRKEVQNVDVLHPDIKCDTTFLKRYIKAYDYWKTYMMLPKEHCYKDYYSILLCDTLAEMGVAVF